MNLRTKILTALIFLALVDALIPIPFTTILLIYVLMEKPPWFKKMTMDIYD
ncbi:hypothetical protein ACFL1N_12560 [Thermodesulfobacteriota bacterium]